MKFNKKKIPHIILEKTLFIIIFIIFISIFSELLKNGLLSKSDVFFASILILSAFATVFIKELLILGFKKTVFKDSEGVSESNKKSMTVLISTVVMIFAIFLPFGLVKGFLEFILQDIFTIAIISIFLMALFLAIYKVSAIVSNLLSSFLKSIFIILKKEYTEFKRS